MVVKTHGDIQDILPEDIKAELNMKVTSVVSVKASDFMSALDLKIKKPKSTAVSSSSSSSASNKASDSDDHGEHAGADADEDNRSDKELMVADKCPAGGELVAYGSSSCPRQIRSKLAKLLGRNGVLKKSIGSMRKGSKLHEADAVKQISDFLCAPQTKTESCLALTCDRQRNFQEMGNALFNMPDGVEFPATEEEITSLVEQGKTVTGLKIEVKKDWLHDGAKEGIKNLMTVAGGPCQDFAGEGPNTRINGARMPSILAWIVMLWAVMPRRAVFENSSRFFADLLTFLLGAMFSSHRERLNPAADSVFGVNRDRLYVGLRRRDLDSSKPVPWMTSRFKSLSEAVAQRRCDPSTALKACDFFVAEVDEHLLSRFTLTQRMEDALTELQEKDPECEVFALDQSASRAGSKSDYLAAIKQNTARRYSVRRKRWLLTGERLLAHGVPVCQWAADALGVRVRSSFLELKNEPQSVLAGNGMHLHSIFAMTVFSATAN